MFLGNQMTRAENISSDLLANERKDQEEEFHQTLESLGATGLFDDEEILKGLWMKLRENDPILLREFEEFLRQTTEEMKRSKSEHRHFELAMQTKSSFYDEEMKRLYDEMEQQMKFERTALIDQVKTNARRSINAIWSSRRKAKNANFENKWRKNYRRKNTNWRKWQRNRWN